MPGMTIVTGHTSPQRYEAVLVREGIYSHSYIFLFRLLPEPGAGQEAIRASTVGEALADIENQIYFIALVAFYGLERVVRMSQGRRPQVDNSRACSRMNSEGRRRRMPPLFPARSGASPSSLLV